MFVELILFLLLVLFVRLFIYKTKAEKMYSKIPGPKPYPIVGNYFEFDYPKVEMFETLRNLSLKYGKVFLLKLGTEYSVCLRDPDDIEVAVTSNKCIDKAPHYDILCPWLGQGLFTSKGDTWRQHRKLLNPAFSIGNLKSFIPVFEKNSRIFANNLLTKTGTDFDVSPMVSACTLDTVCETSMGYKVNAQSTESKYLEAVEELLGLLNHQLMNVWERSFLFPLLPNGRRQKQLIQYLHGITNDLIKTKKHQKMLADKDCDAQNHDESIGEKNNKPFMELILEYNDQGAGFSDKEIREQVDTFIVAGYDTTASIVKFALHALSQHQHVQEKAYNEVTQVFGDSDREATYKDLMELKYVDKVIRETLRLYPLGQFTSRRAGDDLELKSGYRIPKGSTVIILTEFLNHDPQLFKDPQKFNPDRFDDDTIHPYCFMPFGAGLRNCIGYKFAQLQMKVIISNVLRRVQLLPSNIPIDIKYSIMVRSGTGWHIKVQPRHKDSTS